jgi:3-dehydroquinate synthase
MLEIKVDRGNRSYPVFIGYQIRAKAEEIFKLYRFKGKVLLITTPALEVLYRSYIHTCLQPYKNKIYIKLIENSYSQRNLNLVNEIIAFLIHKEFNPHSVIISFGGKNIHDIAGFTARLFSQGIAFIPIPASLYAQLASPVNSRMWLEYQNQYDAVSIEPQPVFAWLDLSFLNTLSRTHLTSGLIEAIRVGIILDEILFDFIEDNLQDLYRLDLKSILFLVHKVCSLKADILSTTQKPGKNPKLLNFGQIVGNVLTKHGKLWNISGLKARFLGPFIEAILAHRLGYLKENDYKRIEALMLRLGVQVSIAKIDFEQLKLLLSQSTDHFEQFAFPKKIGEGILVHRKISMENQ